MLETAFPRMVVYGEESSQERQPPCFFVKVLNDSQSKEFNQRYRQSVSFDIRYFSNHDQPNEDCHNPQETKDGGYRPEFLYGKIDH